MSVQKNLKLKKSMDTMGLGMTIADHTQICSAIFNKGCVSRITPVTCDKLSCPTCKGTKGFVVRDPRYRAWSCFNPKCIAANARKNVAVKPERKPVVPITNSECPLSMCDASLANLDLPLELMEKITRWVRQPVRNLLFYGSSGTGKSYIATAIIAEWLVVQQKTALFRSWDIMHRRWHEEIQGLVPSRQSYQLAEIPLLVIDDIGSRDVSEKFLSALQVILGIRYDCKRPTITTSNLDREAINDILGKPIMSRFNPIDYEIQGLDRRLENQ